jgi:hypothetical protein
MSHHYVWLLYLTISNSDYGTLEECCGVQAAAFDFLLDKEPGSKLMARYLAVYILRFWRRVTETQADAFHNALRFRNATKIIQKPTFSNIAVLLLLAENAMGARFSEDLRRRLVAAGQKT